MTMSLTIDHLDTSPRSSDAPLLRSRSGFIPHAIMQRSPVFCGADIPPVDADRARCPTLNEPCLNATRVASLFSAGSFQLGSQVLRFDNPLQAARRCSTFPTDE